MENHPTIGTSAYTMQRLAVVCSVIDRLETKLQDIQNELTILKLEAADLRQSALVQQELEQSRAARRQRERDYCDPSTLAGLPLDLRCMAFSTSVDSLKSYLQISSLCRAFVSPARRAFLNSADFKQRILTAILPAAMARTELPGRRIEYDGFVRYDWTSRFSFGFLREPLATRESATTTISRQVQQKNFIRSIAGLLSQVSTLDAGLPFSQLDVSIVNSEQDVPIAGETHVGNGQSSRPSTTTTISISGSGTGYSPQTFQVTTISSTTEFWNSLLQGVPADNPTSREKITRRLTSLFSFVFGSDILSRLANVTGDHAPSVQLQEEHQGQETNNNNSNMVSRFPLLLARYTQTYHQYCRVGGSGGLSIQHDNYGIVVCDHEKALSASICCSRTDDNT